MWSTENGTHENKSIYSSMNIYQTELMVMCKKWNLCVLIHSETRRYCWIKEDFWILTVFFSKDRNFLRLGKCFSYKRKLEYSGVKLCLLYCFYIIYKYKYWNISSHQHCKDFWKYIWKNMIFCISCDNQLLLFHYYVIKSYTNLIIFPQNTICEPPFTLVIQHIAMMYRQWCQIYRI